MPKLNRRNMLAGAALTGVFVATSGLAQGDLVEKKADLTGTSILITGCSSGFGRLCAEHFARLGAKVFATMRNLPRQEAAGLQELAREEKLDLHVIEIDVRSDEQVTAGVAEAERINGGALDVLINNAGISVAGPIEIQDMEATQMMFDTNVFGPQRMIRAVLPGMRATKSGQVFNVTSALGRLIIPSYGQYSPTKFAFEALSEQMAYELVQHGIEVTIVQPGAYPTKIWQNADRLTGKLLERADEVHTSAYPRLIAQVRTQAGRTFDSDPMDVPRAIAAVITMPAGTRPLRKPVSPTPSIPQAAINDVSAKTQVMMLGNTPLGPWVRAVHNA